MARPKAATAAAPVAKNTTDTPAAKAAQTPAPVVAPLGFTPVRYIGKRATHTDAVYGTRIFWASVGAVQLVPDAIAAKMMAINHDVYGPAEYNGEAEPALKTTNQPQDDMARQELDMVVQTMDKDALESYAKHHYGRDLDKRHTVDTLRQEVSLLIDQFGMP